jgi:hypothetical protein
MKISDLNNYTVVASGKSDVETKKDGGLLKKASDFSTGVAKGIIEAPIETARMVQGLGQNILGAIDPIKSIGEVKQASGFRSLQGDEATQIDELLKGENTSEKAGKLTAFIGSLLVPTGGAKAVTKGAIKAGEELIEGGAKATNKIANMVSETIKPTVSVEKATGQVLQGKEGIIKQGTEALKAVDTKGVKTFKDLDFKLTDKISTLAKQVDDDLAKDTTKYSLNNLIIKQPTKTGGEVAVNYVDNALNQLDELYTATGDVVAKANIQDLINVAKTQGLTRLEVNDIARTYGQEFSGKAFSKVGDPLTSVNAQMFENTRKGLKDVARAGINGAEAKKADALMSKLYNVKTLTQKNIEAVNKLQQRIEERGLIEKIGHGVSKYADILSGGAIRGVIGGLLPRGAGYKTLNALDLESLLERNLKIIQEAGKIKNVKSFNKKIDSLFTQK